MPWTVLVSTDFKNPILALRISSLAAPGGSLETACRLAAEGGGGLPGYFSGAFQVRRLKRYGSHSRMSSTAVAFRHTGEIFLLGGRVPRIGPDRDLGAVGRCAYADRVKAIRIEQVRDELVVALEVLVAHVEEDNAVASLSALAQQFNRALVALEQRPEQPGHARQPHHLRQRPRRQLRDEPRHQAGLGGCFDHQRKLRGRLGQAHGGLRRGVLRAVNDLAPVDQIGERPRIEAKLLLRHAGQQLGAGFEFGVVKLLPGAVAVEVLRVGGCEEGALVVIEPPGDPRRTRILEVHDAVFVAIEHSWLERLRGPVGQTGEMEFRVGVDPLAVKAQKDRGRCGAIEATIVEAETNLYGHPDSPVAHRRKFHRSEAIKDGRAFGDCQAKSPQRAEINIVGFPAPGLFAGQCNRDASVSPGSRWAWDYFSRRARRVSSLPPNTWTSRCQSLNPAKRTLTL